MYTVDVRFVFEDNVNISHVLSEIGNSFEYILAACELRNNGFGHTLPAANSVFARNIANSDVAVNLIHNPDFR